ncbi:MAG: DPP IV N-terminal domain-containing protein, partial [Planctomycetes bacterium]|nr:DPP IV N-terminal domain-containing protein [Planctomycetota bacterium]
MELTAERVARYPRPGTAIPGKIAFTPDGRRITFLWSAGGQLARELWEMDLAGGERRVLFSAAGAEEYSREEALRRERQRLRETGVTHYAWAADANVLLVALRGDAYVDGKRVERAVVDPQLSRDGKVLAYVRDGELYANGLRLTHDAAPGVTNGLADYLAQEEMHRQTGFWISRDGRWIAFEQADERHIPIYPIVHQAKDAVEIEDHRYPFAGAANPKVRLGVVPAAGGPATWMDLGEAEYLARVAWAPDGRLFVQTQARDQRRLELRTFDPSTGKGRTLLVEESRWWVNLHHDLHFLETGEY